ncbi:cysteine dioxygenase [Armatimonas rosea]|uniref:Putative metal-dependent enzyme (Double-stranded beta helix superfamily) n=1 Tax=Armatimonas rosea TaxID=685828 RepID=A0A7W9SU11_ARMRO|nr:cysteine dioxygenase family protein [Armatimonas rosea]MBB6052811.1 putative metal-dependent enzyme (double-stranded beta helix superfamily) [Armatimonas rosea]
MNRETLIRYIRGRKAFYSDPTQLLHAVTPALARFAQHHDLDTAILPTISKGLYVRQRLTAPDEDFQLIAAFWGPQSAAPIHDHDEVTGAVTALQGTVSETKFALKGSEKNIVFLEASETETLGIGQVSPIYPGEALQRHDMRNNSETWAVTLHLYLTPLVQFRIYVPNEEGGYSSLPRTLWFD